MEISRLELEITTCKVAVLPIKPYPLAIKPYCRSLVIIVYINTHL